MDYKKTALKKKILIILPTLHAGGAENYLLRFLSFVGNDEFDFTVLSINEEHGDLHKKFENTGAKISYLSISYFNPFRFFRFFRFLKNNQFDTICTFTGHFGGIPIYIGWIAGIPNRIAWHRRSTIAFQRSVLKSAYHSIISALLRKYATQILSNSAFALQNFYGDHWQRDSRMKVIPNGVDPSHISTQLSKSEARKKFQLPQDKFIIGHVGRFDPAKNHPFYFEVIAKLNRQKYKVHALFCGKNTDTDDFLKLQSTYGIRQYCTNIGLSTEVGAVLKTMDLFLFPSITEGNPNALIEAMIAGVNILASDIPPHRECIPVEYQSALISTRLMDTFIDRINQLISDKQEDHSSENLKNFALKEFSPNARFIDFLNQLKK